MEPQEISNSVAIYELEREQLFHKFLRLAFFYEA